MQNVLFDANEKALCVNLYSLKYLYFFETSFLFLLSPIVYLKEFLMLETNFISLGSCFSGVVIVNQMNSVKHLLEFFIEKLTSHLPEQQQFFVYRLVR